MPIPVFVIPVAGVVVGGAVVRIVRTMWPSGPVNVVLVGPPSSGKTSLASAMSNEPFSRQSHSTTAGTKSFAWATTGTQQAIHITDMPGADAHRAWHEQIKRLRPDLVCLLIDYRRLVEDEDAYQTAEVTAQVVRDMAAKRTRALVLTHTDLVPETALHPELAGQHPRVEFLQRRLAAKHTTSGSLVTGDEASSLASKVLAWLQ